MASTFKTQIPADAHALLQLLCKLGLTPGPMKSAKIDVDGQINIWFVLAPNTADIKRTSAKLVRGVSEVCQGSPRRVYLDVRVQSHAGEWRNLTDADYIAASLEAPHVYDGESYVAIRYDVARGEGEYWDAGSEAWNANETIPYHRLLEGDRERALDEARQRVEAFERGE